MIKTREKVFFKDLGLTDYKKAWDIQEKILKEIVDIKLANRDIPLQEQIKGRHHLLFCEHPPVITLGRSGSIKKDHGPRFYAASCRLMEKEIHRRSTPSWIFVQYDQGCVGHDRFVCGIFVL